MKLEVKELSKMVCKDCSETDYQKCQSCRIHQLINSMAS